MRLNHVAKLTLGFVDSSFFFIYRLCCTSLQFYIFFLCDKKIRSCLLLHSTLRTDVVVMELLIKTVSSLFQRDQCLPSRYLFLKRRTVL